MAAIYKLKKKSYGFTSTDVVLSDHSPQNGLRTLGFPAFSPKEPKKPLKATESIKKPFKGTFRYI